MCGLAGMYSPGGLDRDAGEQLRHMTDTLRHRGPDDDGWWLDAEAGIGARPSAAVDHRPVADWATSRWARPTAATCSPTTARSTTSPSCARELEAARPALPRATRTPRCCSRRSRAGAWCRRCARAQRDVRLRALGPARSGACTWCATGSARSRCTTARHGRHPAVRLRAQGAAGASRAGAGEIDRDALALYLRHSYVPAPHSIYRGRVQAAAGDDPRPCRRRRARRADGSYWDSAPSREDGAGATPLAGSDRSRWRTSSRRCSGATVAREMVADVPLGAFLSGGIDSSLVVALMQAQSAAAGEDLHDRLRRDRATTRRRTRGRSRATSAPTTPSCYVTPGRGAGGHPASCPTIYDEPFADSSQIPTLLVSQLARRHVTVACPATAATSCSAATTATHWGRRLWRTLARHARGRSATGGARALVHGVPSRAWDTARGLGARLLPRGASSAGVRCTSCAGRRDPGARAPDELYRGRCPSGATRGRSWCRRHDAPARC